MFYENHRGKFFYTDEGEGHPVLLLRGLGRTVSHWLGFEKLLAKKTRVICMDHRGIGRTTASMGALDTMFDLADDVIDLLDHLKIEKCHVFGISLGGMVAMALGLKYPDRLSGVVIANSSIAGSGFLRLTPRGMQAIGGRVLAERKFHTGLARILTSHKATDDQINSMVDQWIQIEKSEGLKPKTIVYQLGAAARLRIKKDLAKFKPKALVLVGLDDAFVPQINSHIIAQAIPNARLVKVDNAGHEITHDRPDLVVDLILKELPI